ncbi:MAG: ABC transporter ATP-binding protein [Verrucomicrobiota bacterium]|jgi:multiple sugar transport system ATP-binding protein
MARVVVENLTKVFPGSVRAVQGVSLAVEEKECLALVGPSGCGKTTLLRMIAGLEQPTSGTVAIEGQVVNDLAAKDRQVAMVFQHHALYPHLSVYENLAFGLRLRKCPPAEIRRRVKAAAEALGLTACLERRPRELSGGQHQRVALGRALVRQPKVFLLDEPLSNLDAPMRAQLRAEFARLQVRLGTTAIYVTHDQAEAMMLGRRIAVMKEGAIQQVAEPGPLYRHPANLFVAGFIGFPTMNFFKGKIVQRAGALLFEDQVPAGAAPQGRLALRLDESMAGRMKDWAERSVILGIRPEHIAQRIGVSDAPPAQTVEAMVEVVQPMGAESYLNLSGMAQSFVARVPATDPVSVLERVSLVFDMGRAHFFDALTERAIG